MYCILVVCYLLDYPCLYEAEGESELWTENNIQKIYTREKGIGLKLCPV